MKGIVVGLALTSSLLMLPLSFPPSAATPNLNGSFRFTGTLTRTNANGHPR